jgi:hypothetical protein
MDALDTYTYLSGGFAEDEENPFAILGNTLQDLWDNSEILEVHGYVEDEPWHFDVHRRMFTIASIEGSINSIDAECERRLLSLEYQPDVEWGLPDSFGDCAIYISAEPGTSFTFYEMLPPNEQ